MRVPIPKSHFLQAFLPCFLSKKKQQHKCNITKYDQKNQPGLNSSLVKRLTFSLYKRVKPEIIMIGGKEGIILPPNNKFCDNSSLIPTLSIIIDSSCLIVILQMDESSSSFDSSDILSD
jgi:hypothetical protein